MIAVLDANVLYPTVLREILTDIAAAGLYQPVWSQRILDEWRHVAARHGADQAATAGARIALLRDRFPAATVSADGDASHGLDLPDPADAHVVEAALNGQADLIVTANLRDFPRAAMMAVGLRAIHPDAFLAVLWADNPDLVAKAARNAHARAAALGGPVEFRALMKRAQLPRLARAIARSEGC